MLNYQRSICLLIAACGLLAGCSGSDDSGDSATAAAQTAAPATPPPIEITPVTMAVTPSDSSSIPAEVLAKLTELKLVPAAPVEEFNETIVKGNVIRLDPATGTQVPRDSAVTVFVSKGPEPKPIPNLFGFTVLQAAAKLREAGFDVGDTKGAADRQVQATDPPVGALRVPGTKVDIITSTR